MCLYKTMELIHGMAITAIAGELGADTLFPLYLYVTIHAALPNLHSHLEFMADFAAPEEQMTQLGYCLTTFQGNSQSTLLLKFFDINPVNHSMCNPHLHSDS